MNNRRVDPIYSFEKASAKNILNERTRLKDDMAVAYSLSRPVKGPIRYSIGGSRR
jgi:hypothetical protein